MGIFDDILGNTVGRIPVVGDTFQSIGIGLGNIVTPFWNAGESLLHNAMSLTTNLSNAGVALASNLASVVSTPYFTYALIGVGIYIVYKIASDPKTASNAVQYMPQGRLGKMASNYI